MTGDSVLDDTSNMIANKVIAWREAKLQATLAEAAVKELEDEVTMLCEVAGGVDTKPLGMNRVARSGGFDKAIIPMLKKNGIRSAVKTAEKVDAAEVAAALATGELTEEDVAAFRKPDTMFYKMCKVGGDE